MKEYYLKTENRVLGPFLLDDLKYQKIRPNTEVRTNETNHWTLIKDDPDLNFLLRIQSGYSYSGHNEANPQHREKSAKKPSILIIAILIFLLGLGFAIYVLLGVSPM